MAEHMTYTMNEGLLFIAILALQLLAAETCFWIGRRGSAEANDSAKSQLGTLQGAVLGLLALLLGFTLSMSISRFETRKQLILDEANAIGTAHLRAELLPEPERAQLQELLRQYVDVRVEFYAATDDTQRLDDAVARTEQLQRRLWSDAVAVAKRDTRTVITGLFIAALNDVIDLHGKRVAALENRIPVGVFWLLYAIAIVAMGLSGYAGGAGGRRSLFPTVAASLLISGVILLIVDLHRPRRGLITVGQQSMIDLKNCLDRSGQ